MKKKDNNCYNFWAIRFGIINRHKKAGDFLSPTVSPSSFAHTNNKHQYERMCEMHGVQLAFMYVCQ